MTKETFKINGVDGKTIIEFDNKCICDTNEIDSDILLGFTYRLTNEINKHIPDSYPNTFYGTINDRSELVFISIERINRLLELPLKYPIKVKDVNVLDSEYIKSYSDFTSKIIIKIKSFTSKGKSDSDKLNEILDIISNHTIPHKEYNMNNINSSKDIYLTENDMLKHKIINTRYDSFNIKFPFTKIKDIQSSGRSVPELKENLSIEAKKAIIELKSTMLDLETLILDCNHLSDGAFYEKYIK